MKNYRKLILIHFKQNSVNDEKSIYDIIQVNYNFLPLKYYLIYNIK